jgi:hypothetical protein
MNKPFVVFGVLLFIVGSFLIFGSYFFFNRFSFAGSGRFGPEAFARLELLFPEAAVELENRDEVAVHVSMFYEAEQAVTVSLVSTVGDTIQLSRVETNTTIHYLVEKDGFYCCHAAWSGGYTGSPANVTLNVDVVRNAPNFPFLLGGGILLFAGTITIPIAVFYKGKNGKTTHPVTPLQTPS